MLLLVVVAAAGKVGSGNAVGKAHLPPTHSLCSLFWHVAPAHSVGWDSVAWPHLSVRKAGKGSLVSCPRQEDRLVNS